MGRPWVALGRSVGSCFGPAVGWTGAVWGAKAAAPLRGASLAYLANADPLRTCAAARRPGGSGPQHLLSVALGLPTRPTQPQPNPRPRASRLAAVFLATVACTTPVSTQAPNPASAKAFAQHTSSRCEPLGRSGGFGKPRATESKRWGPVLPGRRAAPHVQRGSAFARYTREARRSRAAALAARAPKRLAPARESAQRFEKQRRQHKTISAADVRTLAALPSITPAACPECASRNRWRRGVRAVGWPGRPSRD